MHNDFDPIHVQCGRDFESSPDDILLGFVQMHNAHGEAFAADWMMPTWTDKKPENGRARFIRLRREEAQVLMDKLYDQGLKPTQSHGSPGQIAAMEANLHDLREIIGVLIARRAGQCGDTRKTE